MTSPSGKASPAGVRNTEDGSLEAELEGEPSAVEAVLEWARQGPEQARVDEVSTTDLDPTGQSGFTVR